ncbi:MAG: hypothetical protein AB8W37_12680 [Arsenophonus endosymbiont of Dermacentor nuttalli]
MSLNPFADWSIISPTIKQDVGLPALPIDLKQWQHSIEKILLEQTLQIGQFNKRQAEQQLKLTYYKFRGLLKKYNLPNS